jgi:hypothetical protein
VVASLSCLAWPGLCLACQATKLLQGIAARLASIESDVKIVMAVAGQRLRGMTATGFTLGVLLNGFTLLLAVSGWGWRGALVWESSQLFPGNCDTVSLIVIGLFRLL